MFKILKYLKNSIPTVVLIIVLLVVQAFAELALPEYTAKIVDVGIQQGGIEDIAPTQMRRQTMEALSALMTDDELALVHSAYALEGNETYVRQTSNKDTVAALNDAFLVPMVGMLTMQNQTGFGIEEIASMADNGLMPREQILQMREEGLSNLGEVNESMVKQQAVMFTKAEYEAMGMDMGSLQTNYLLITGAKMMGITLVMMAAAILVGLLAARTAATIGTNLRGSIFSKVLSFSTGDMDKFSTASLITRSTNDIQQVQMVTVMLLRMIIYSPILGIGGVLKVVNTNTGMGWIIFVAVAVILVIVGLLFTIAMPKFRKRPILIDRINQVAREILTGVQVIRAFSREEYEEERFDEANTNLKKTQMFTNRVMNFMMPLMMLVMNVITLAIVWFGAKGVDMGNLQVGDMMAFITYTMQIVMSFLMLSLVSIMLPQASVSAGRIDEVLNTEPSVADAKDAASNNRQSWRGEIAFDNVSFRYPDAEEDVLRDISFTARPGETTAVIGSTGSGKSTLLNLIPRFFDVTQGSVKLDGVDIRTLTQHDLRAQLGYVPQKGVLFSGDIESNIKFGGDYITDAEMVEAARIAQAEDFIEQREEKYKDPIAQSGTNVSGGQKQRLSIARAIAKQPRVLLFDDSFSALDYKTDVALRHALEENIDDVTVVIVAQRISTVLHADQILVLDEGRVVGKGTHGELMETCELYQEIARSQLSEAELKGGK